MLWQSLLKPRFPHKSRSRIAPLCFWRQRRQPVPCFIHTSNELFRVSREVSDALKSNLPVVALETTIYTHGFQYPDNIALALHLEHIVRSNGGVPATIGILNGIGHVGLEKNELIELLERPGAEKVSRRDIAFLVGLGPTGRHANGGTTIAGTMVLAHLAGIKVFATGGLGGVHKGGETSLDISADLTELGRTPIAVISSGCKSFLDLARTLEYLETEGVAVATFSDGRPGSVDFPAFWSRDSGLKSPKTIQNEEEAAKIIHAQNSLNISSGLLFANPVPAEASIPRTEINSYIDEAIGLAIEAGATGSDNTPFILRSIKELSRGKSVIANRILVESNVQRGTRVAVELAKLNAMREVGRTVVATTSQEKLKPATDSRGLAEPEDTSPIDVLVAGSLAIDTFYDYSPLASSTKQPLPKLYTSNPAKISQKLGGVGHNVAYAAHLMGSRVRLFSVLAEDGAGKIALSLLSNEGLHTTSIKILSGDESAVSAQYTAFNDADKSLHMAMADMTILERLEPNIDQYLASQLEELKPKWLVVDANWDHERLQAWMITAKSMGISVAFEPVSQEKALRLLQRSTGWTIPAYPNAIVDLATPNALELLSMHSAAREVGLFDRQDWWEVINLLGIPVSGARSRLTRATSVQLVDQGIPQQSIQLLPFIQCIFTKLGRDGVLLTRLVSPQELDSTEIAPHLVARAVPGAKVGGVYMRLFPSPEMVLHPVSVNGTGDSFMGALISSLVNDGNLSAEDVINTAQRASIMTLKSEEAVHPNLGILAPTLKKSK